MIIAIDDFGTGYSSLSYLRRLPVRAVKLDRALLDGILTDPKARGLVGAVTGLADVLGLMVVAEGLEDLDTIRTVYQLGAGIGQGYALSPAVPAAWMARILRQGRLDTGLLGTGPLRFRSARVRSAGCRSGGEPGQRHQRPPARADARAARSAGGPDLACRDGRRARLTPPGAAGDCDCMRLVLVLGRRAG